MTLDQFAKENHQQKLKDDVPEAQWSFSSPQDRSQHLLELLTEQQASVRELIAGQADLLGVIEKQHRELCERLDGRGSGPSVPGPATKIDLSKVAEVSEDLNKTFFSPLPKPKVRGAASRRASVDDPSHSASHNAIKAQTEEDLRFMRSMGVSTRTLPEDASFAERLRFKMRKAMNSPWFDMAMGLIIVLNVMCVFIQFEWKGLYLATKLQMGDDDGDWPQAEKVFMWIESGFCAIYAVELVARIYLFRWRAVARKMDILDIFIVVASCVDAWILTPLSSDNEGTFVLARLLRLLRITRVLRAIKVVRFLAIFAELRVMLRSLTASIASLLWSMLFVSFVIVAGGVLMVQLSVGFLEDPTLDPELQKWVYLHFGTAARSTWTIFEATFTTNWPSRARRMVMEVSPWFSIFWVFYTVVVNFAIMRVIAALFLKQTLAVAHSDEERSSMEKMQQKEAFAEKIRDIFLRGDKLGDGVLHRWEFEAMMEDTEAQAMFNKLDLTTNEMMSLYEIMSDRDGVVDYEEFLAGALKMKNASRTLDMIEVLHEQMVLRRSVEILHSDCKRFFGAFLAASVGDISSGPGAAAEGAADASDNDVTKVEADVFADRELSPRGTEEHPRRKRHSQQAASGSCPGQLVQQIVP